MAQSRTLAARLGRLEAMVGCSGPRAAPAAVVVLYRAGSDPMLSDWQSQAVQRGAAVIAIPDNGRDVRPTTP